MVEAEYVERIEAPASKVWPYFQWENLALMLPGGFFAGIDYEEKRPVAGAKRRLTLGDGSVLIERLEAQDDDGRQIVYRMLDTGGVPVADYLGEVRVSGVGPEACFVRFASTCTPVGMSAQEWQDLYANMQRGNLAYIRAQVEG